jgi:hypothetical protein
MYESYDIRELVRHTIISMTDLPIIERLRFVSNLLLSRGGEATDPEGDPHIVIAREIINETISVLKAHPRAARLDDNKL